MKCNRSIMMLVCILAWTSLFVYFPSSVSADGNNRPQYQMDVRYHEKEKKVTGSMTVTLPKQKKEQKEIYFRLYPNVFRDWKYGKESKPKQPGFLDVSQVKVNGEAVKATTQETVMRVPLSKPLPVGKTAKIEMQYELKIPQGGTRLNTFKQTAFLAQWYPMLAVQDEEGWHTEPYTTTGDPFYSQISDFEVTFHLPKGYQVITTAKDPQAKIDDTVTLRQDRVRDFVAVLSKDYHVMRGTANGVKVNLWYLEGMKEVTKQLHQAAIDGMKFYSKQFGEYPYPEVDVVLGDTGFGIAGMEYPGLVTSLPKVPTMHGTTPAVNVVVHELAHQWWYGVVGNNQVKEPWLDEGITTFSEFYFMEKQMKQNERGWLKKAVEKSDEAHQKVGVSSAQSLYDYPDSVYGLMVYIRPAAMMFELTDQLGEDKVMSILKTYYHKYRYQVATTQDFIQVANQVAGKDLTPFFHQWLYFK